MSPIAIVAVFVGVLMGLALVAAVVVLLSAPPPPVAQCQPGQPCSDPPASLPPIAEATAQPSGAPPSATVRPSAPAPSPSPSPLPTGAPASPVPTETPTSDSPPAVSGTVWRDDSLSYSFEYDDRVFTLSQSNDGLAVLDGNFFDTQVVIRAVPAATSPRQLIDEQLARVDRFLIGRVADTDPYDALLGPSIGYIRGEGGVFSGTLVSQDGTPLAPGGVTIVASTDGRITVAVLAIVGTPDVLLGSDTHQNAVRSAADEILKTFDWDAR
jgi:hypothetical protein